MVNKEANLGLLQQRLGQGRNYKQIEEERVVKVREKLHSHHRIQMPDGILPVGHSNVAITQINKMG